MLQRLAGNEPGLVALYSFDDFADPGKDTSPSRHHGELVDSASVREARLPAVVFGRITDTAGRPLAGAVIDVHQEGQPLKRFPANGAPTGLTRRRASSATCRIARHPGLRKSPSWPTARTPRRIEPPK
jgi:hypothetical protein